MLEIEEINKEKLQIASTWMKLQNKPKGITTKNLANPTNKALQRKQKNTDEIYWTYEWKRKDDDKTIPELQTGTKLQQIQMQETTKPQMTKSPNNNEP